MGLTGDLQTMNILLEQFSVFFFFFFFHQFTPLRRVQGLQCSAYDQYFIYKSDAFLGGFLSSTQRSELYINVSVICCTVCIYHSILISYKKILTKLGFSL